MAAGTPVRMTRLLAACIVAIGVAAGPADARQDQPLVGPVTHVRDGDTIEVNGVAVRLNGLHAPEMHERGGPQARAWMVEHTRGQRIV